MLKCPNCGNTYFNATRNCTQYIVVDGNENVVEISPNVPQEAPAFRHGVHDHH